MNKTVKNSLIVIAIVVCLFAIIWFVYDMLKEEPADEKVSANLADGNTGLDNIINDLFENSVENEIERSENIIDDEEKNMTVGENTVEEKKDDKKQDNNKNTLTSKPTTESVTSKEERAIELVKKEWGTTDGVYFSKEGFDSKGRYIVSVHDKQTTASLAFYVVDLDTNLVTER